MMMVVSASFCIVPATSFPSLTILFLSAYLSFLPSFSTLLNWILLKPTSIQIVRIFSLSSAARIDFFTRLFFFFLMFACHSLFVRAGFSYQPFLICISPVYINIHYNLSLYLSIYLAVYIYFYLPVYCMYACVCDCFHYVYYNPSIYLSIYLSIYHFTFFLSFFLSIKLSWVPWHSS